MASHYAHQIRVSGKELLILAANLNSPIDLEIDLDPIFRPAFTELAPYLKRDRQVVYIRDIKAYAIDDVYPGGYARIPEELVLAVPEWPADETQLRATAAHELHHLARWQNGAERKILGDAITHEGLGTFYEELRSGWLPPWAKSDIPKEAWVAVRKEWDNEKYDYSGWFFKGPYGRGV